MPANHITAMYRAGDRRTWVLLLACGHKRIVTNQQAKEEQLYVGKRISCAEPHAKEIKP